MRNLELFSSSYEQKSQHSLFALLDTCHTAMGSRLLMQQLQYPSRNSDWLAEQHRLYQFLETQDIALWNSFFKQIPDIERSLSLLHYKGAQGSKIQQLRNVGALLLEEGPVQAYLRSCCKEDNMDISRHLFQHLMTVCIAHQPLGDQGYIQDGYDPEVDRLRQLVYHTDDVLLAYQQTLVGRTGITGIRLKYVANQGYVLEVSPQYQATFESFRQDDEQYDFMRSSSLKAGERYTTSYLNALESRIIQAKSELARRQQELLDALAKEILSHQSCMQGRAQILARYDLLVSHLQFARQHVWTLPRFSEQSLSIEAGRHPLVEHFLDAHQQFIANDLSFSQDDSFHLITGPNMGGKTTYLKQNALIVLFAHAGLFVPAASATIPYTDALFARIGTGDILAKQQSTFMTEMIEMANILHNATERSFLVLDEIGRGTSTYDGLALARAICEFLVTKTKSKTLFATHYHELTQLEKEYSAFHTYCVSVYESDQDVVFLKKICKGAANKSYGIHVAERAGLPNSVLESAKKHLKQFESQKSGPTLIQQGLFSAPLPVQQKSSVERSLEEIDINSITPMQALVYLSELKSQIY